VRERLSRTTTIAITLVLLLDLVAVSVAAGVVNLDPTTARAGSLKHAKVAIIVGPVGGLTDEYRRIADRVAATARARSDEVVTVYSPNATWPAAKAALDDANIVVYLGHGNGFPSPYRDEPYARTQNGLGLNPVAGQGDDAHQYFGEQYIARQHLAPGAVVILSHLCYASGNPEPGGPEPTVDVARQRVDNFAAGWLAAGAVAVVAEGFGDPSYYVKAVLSARGSIGSIWRHGPTFHDNVVAFASDRTADAHVELDPDHAHRGFYRSLTVVGDDPAIEISRARPDKVARPAGPKPVQEVPDPTDLALLGARFGDPEVAGDPVANVDAAVAIPIDRPTVKLLPTGFMMGTRWTLIAADDIAADAPGADSDSAADPSPGAEPAPSEATTTTDSAATGVDLASTNDAASPASAEGATESLDAATSISEVDEASASAEAAPDPPVIELISPETPSTIVETVQPVIADRRISFHITMPEQAGLYRLVTTIHDADGVALGAETQELFRALVVRVTGSVWASYGLPSTITVDAGQTVDARVRIANTGTTSWQGSATETPGVDVADRVPLLVSRWVGLDDITTFAAQPGPTTIVPAAVEPGDTTIVDVTGPVPEVPGNYLLLFDIQDSDGISLASLGVPPGLIRVTVQPAAASDNATAHLGPHGQ
jgi:hypothetical protein